MYSSLSRLLFLNDPILTYSTLMLCLHSYVPAHVGPRAWEDPLLSPGNASDEILSRFPPTQIMVGDIDPLLDDSVCFAKRLLKVIPSLLHTSLCGIIKLRRSLPLPAWSESDLAALRESPARLHERRRSASVLSACDPRLSASA
jgi:hypothetical protein